MKPLGAALAFIAIGMLLDAESADSAAKPDPLVGRWRCSHKVMVEIRADGTATHTGNVAGAWKSVPTDTAERKYQISWKGGAVVDAVTLDKSLKRYAAKNNEGFKYTAERVED